MKLKFFFALFDMIILLSYPIAYIYYRLKRMKGVK